MSEKVIALLNEARARELLAISQYMVEHYELDDADFGSLAKKVKEIAIVEMKHAESLGERVLFLGGTVNTKPAGEAKKKLSILDMMKENIKLEVEAVKMYNDSAKACVELGDNVSKKIFEELLGQEEDHQNDFENILDHIEKLGDSYLATQAG